MKKTQTVFLLGTVLNKSSKMYIFSVTKYFEGFYFIKVIFLLAIIFVSQNKISAFRSQLSIDMFRFLYR